MLSETVVTALLEASITGAGLVLAIYALITPISRKIFEDRARRLQGLIDRFEKEKNQITVDTSDKDFKHLNQLRKEIQQVRVFPMYWGFGIVATFFFFGISAIGDVGWLANSANRTSVNEFTMLVFFFLAISLFLVVGIFTIIEIFYSMKKEFEDIKKKQKEVKGTTSYGISTVLVRGDAKVKEKKHEPQNE